MIHPQDLCPGEWKVGNYHRPSHSMFHGSMHECQREYGHRGKCRCHCGRQRLLRWFWL